MTKDLKGLLEAKKKEYLKRIDALNPKYFVAEGVKTDELGFQHDIKTQWDWIESEIVSAFSLGQQSTLQEVEEGEKRRTELALYLFAATQGINEKIAQKEIRIILASLSHLKDKR